MIRSSRLSFKRMGGCAPGELCRISSSKAADLALCLECSDDAVRFGILPDTSWSSAMSLASFSPNELCVSYGTDWYLEESGDPVAAQAFFHEARSHHLYLTETGLVLKFVKEADYGRGQSYYFDLASSKKIPTPDRSCGIPSWRIWESFELAGVGSPLIEVSPKGND